MERIYYGGTSFVLDDDVAMVLVGYLERLIATGSSDVVTVPVEYVNRSIGELDLLLTPASVIGFEPVGGETCSALHDERVIDRMQHRTSELDGRDCIHKAQQAGNM